VLLPLPLEHSFTYSVPEGMGVEKGSLVEVPWGKQKKWGVVWERDVSLPGPSLQIKAIGACLGVSPLPAVTQAFVAWVASYTLASPGRVLKMVVPVPQALEPLACEPLYGLNPGYSGKASPVQTRLKAFFQEHPGHPGPLSLGDLSQQTGLKRDALKRSIKRGSLEKQGEAMQHPEFPVPSPRHATVTFTPQQTSTLKAMLLWVEAASPKPILLEGLTGSGKTELYFEAVQTVLEQGKQVLVLLPEIALTTQWLSRFEARFGVKPAVWHANVSPSKRVQTWRALSQKKVWVVVGARSALFLPYADLGLIVVDEEHDSSYKQEEGVIYQGRDMAVVRGALGKIPVLLASATPSLETLWNVQQGRYHHVKLEERYQAELPSLKLIDLRPEKGAETPKQKASWVSPPLQQHLRQVLSRGEQSLLFLNRRGYAPLMLCKSCGFRFTCNSCQTFLVVHQQETKLACHHCGHQRPFPSACPSCQQADSFLTCGPGVEQIEQDVKALFPQARTTVMSRDTLTSVRAMQQLMEAMEAQTIDILIGTQLVVKGHHFPNLTCVGIIDGDLSLYGSDPRACERTYQLLSQVAGRAGRAAKPGHVFLQTYDPQHPALQALEKGEAAAFLRQEMQVRQAHHLPPYYRLAALILSGEAPHQVEDMSHLLRRKAPPHPPDVEVLGPVLAPLSRLRGKTRWRLLIKAPKSYPLQAFLKTWLARVKLKSSVQLTVDIDPYHFL
jgi:primosomal protein N' (replication factor Y) (superfamily II helicase)